MKLSEINESLAAGNFVWTGNRQGISKAAGALAAVEAKIGCVWVFMTRTGLWDEVAESAIKADTNQTDAIQSQSVSKGVDTLASKKAPKKSSKGFGTITRVPAHEREARQHKLKVALQDEAPEQHEETMLIEVDDEPIPQLEKAFKYQVDRQDRAKALSNEAKEFEAQCMVIMGDFNISKYKRGNVRIYIKTGPPHVDGSIE